MADGIDGVYFFSDGWYFSDRSSQLKGPFGSQVLAADEKLKDEESRG